MTDEKPNVSDLVKGFASSLEGINRMTKAIQPISSSVLVPDIKLNPAKWTYERLGKYIVDFEADLDDQHEIGARLVSFGSTITFHIQSVGYYGPDIITFHGISDKGEK